MEHLSTLPRGKGALGFYESDLENVPVRSMRFGDEMLAEERLDMLVLRTDTETFRQLVEARRNRVEGWFVDPGGRVGLCNVPLPVRLEK
jgi:peptidylprolyl isomerase